MKFTLNRVIHYYYFFALTAMTMAFGYGVYYYWGSGLLNIDFVSNLYDGSNRVKIVKDRNDLEELKRLVESDRIKEALKVVERLDQDIRDLRPIKNTDGEKTFNENYTKLKNSLAGLQARPELSGILSSIATKVSLFESFVTEKKWPTLMRMSIALRNKSSQSRIVTGGMYNTDRVVNLSQSINNDLEAMNNFTISSGLAPEIKIAIQNRIKTIKNEADGLTIYIDEHKSFLKIHKDFSVDYSLWFKLVEPEISLKKMQFEKNSQSLVLSIIAMVTMMFVSIVLGVLIYNFTKKHGSEKIERLILESVKDGLLPIEGKSSKDFSPGFTMEMNKYHDYIHRRMAFGSVFQEAMPFASILLDSNLNVIWGNSHFYAEWKLENFKDEDDTLTWDFLQRFTDLEDNSSILSALRMAKSGNYKIQIKTTSMDNPIPYEMHVSPVDVSAQKRIMVIFYPMIEAENYVNHQRESIIDPMCKAIEAQQAGRLSIEDRNLLRESLEKVSSGLLFKKVFEYVDARESELDDKNKEIERLEVRVDQQNNQLVEIRKAIVGSFELQRSSAEEFNRLKNSVGNMIDSRDQIEEQLKAMVGITRELFKDQNRIVLASEKAEMSVDEYIRSVKTIMSLKTEFKELKVSVEDFKSRIIQVLDQLLIFQNHDGDTVKIDQLVGKIKIELKGFEKILFDFNKVVTQLDVTVTKIDMMAETREKVDLSYLKAHMDTMKNNIDNVQFSASKLTQFSHQKDDELIGTLKVLVGNLKGDMKRVDEVCKLSGLTTEHLNIISPRNEASI